MDSRRSTAVPSAPGAVLGCWQPRYGALRSGSTSALAVPLAGYRPRVVAASPAAEPAKKKTRTEKPWAKTLIGGGVTIFFEMAGGHALEFLKIDKQVTNLPYREIIRKMTAQKGLAGTLDGFFPWGCLQSTLKGAVFGWGQAMSLGMLSKFDFLDPQQAMVLSGGCGGFVQGIVMSPALLLKTRVMTDPRFRSSGGVLQTTIASAKLGGEIIRNEGIAVMTKGMGVFAFKRFCDWTTRYLFVEVVQEIIKGDEQRKLTMGEKMFSALAGGTLSALVTVPIDVMVAIIQDAGKSGQKVSIVETFSAQMRSGGIGGIARLSTRGLAARVTHVAMTTLMMKTVTSAVYDVCFPPQ